MSAAVATALPPGAADRVAQAHARLLHDATIQFSFQPIQRPPQPPSWLVEALKLLFKLIAWAAPVLKLLFWPVLVCGLVLILVLLAREFLLYRRPGKRAPALSLSAREDWRPGATAAKALLSEADRLAAEGRFEEAAHLILFRSIEDIKARRPNLIAPSLTSRDIAGLEALPKAGRPAFALIARYVEKALFGGRALDAQAYADCRRAYEAFAFPEAWAAEGLAA